AHGRQVVFLADKDRRPLMYPRPDRRPDHVLAPGEDPGEPCRRLTEGWLTDEGAMTEDSPLGANSPLPVPVGYAPGAEGRGDDDWGQADLRFLVLRVCFRDDVREELGEALRRLREDHPRLVVEGLKPNSDEVLVRGFAGDSDHERGVREVRRALAERF